MENNAPQPLPPQVNAPPAPPLNPLPPPVNPFLQPPVNLLPPPPPLNILPPRPPNNLHLLPPPPGPNNAGNFVQNEQNGQQDFGPVTFVTMSGGGQKLCFGGYYYVKHKEISDGKTTYRCEKCNGDRATKCYGRIHERNGRCVFKSIAEHNHQPNAVRTFQLQVLSMCSLSLTVLKNHLKCCI